MGLGPRDQFSLCIRYCPAPFPQLNLYIWPLFSLYLQSWGLESNNPSSNPHFSISIWITFGSLPQFLHLYNLVILVQWLVGNTKTSILSQWPTDWRTFCGLSPIWLTFPCPPCLFLSMLVSAETTSLGIISMSHHLRICFQELLSF